MPDPAPNRDQPQELQTHKELDDKVTLARGVVSALERALRSRRLYEMEHRLRQESIGDLVSRFDGFFERYSYLRLDVTDSELKLAGRSLMKCEPRDPELPFLFYKDGIRELRFHRGLPQEEILAFLTLFDLDAKQRVELDMDLVSSLWSKDFKAIDAMTVDEFEMVDGEPASPGDRESQGSGDSLTKDFVRLLEVVSSFQRGPGAGPGKEGDGSGGKGPNPGPASDASSTGQAPEAVVPLRQAPTPFAKEELGPPMSDAELDALFSASVDEGLRSCREEVDRETLGAVIQRAVDILVGIFTESERVLADEVRPLLRGLVGLHARKGDFARLGHLLFQLKEKKFLQRVEGGDALWKELLLEIQSPDVRKLLLGHLNGGFTGDTDGLKFYFELVDAALVPDVCSIYAQVKSAKARVPLRDYLVSQGRRLPGSIKGLLAGPDAVLGEAFEIYRQVNPPTLVGELEGVLDRLPRALKLDGLGLGARTEGPLRARLFKKALADPDASVRAHALKVMGEGRGADVRSLVQEWIEAKDFGARQPGEKVLAYSTLARIGGAAGLAYFKDLVQRKPSLFDSQRIADLRRIAVQALGLVELPEARKLLEEWAVSGDRQLKEWAAQALKGRG